jgi:hypothetical protein
MPALVVRNGMQFLCIYRASRMKTWMGDFRIESTLILPADVPEMRATLPDSELSIQNAGKDDLPNEALAAQIIVHADTIAGAEETANARIREVPCLVSRPAAFSASRADAS